MKQKYLITGLMVAIFAGGITCLTSCDDDLVINKAIDESAYTGIYETMDTCVTESPICPLT